MNDPMPMMEPPPPVVLKPKRQPVPAPMIQEEEPFMGIDRLWYDYDEEPAVETTQRLWSEIDQLHVPLEGEPHDLWWSATKGNSDT
jgi:hypothetical protein